MQVGIWGSFGHEIRVYDRCLPAGDRTWLVLEEHDAVSVNRRVQGSGVVRRERDGDGADGALVASHGSALEVGFGGAFRDRQQRREFLPEPRASL